VSYVYYEMPAEWVAALINGLAAAIVLIMLATILSLLKT